MYVAAKLFQFRLEVRLDGDILCPSKRPKEITLLAATIEAGDAASVW